MIDSVKRINDTSYVVSSQSGNGSSYNVNATDIGWNCSCPDHVYRGVKCKHIYAVEISFAALKNPQTFWHAFCLFDRSATERSG